MSAATPSALRLSYSQLDRLCTCPQSYYRHYILREPDILGAPLIIGRAVHMALEGNFTYRKAHGVDMPPKEVAELYRDIFNQEASKPIFTDIEDLTEDKVDWGGENPKDLKAQGQKMLLRYLRDHVPFLNPLEIELRIEREVSSDISVVGVIDLITTAQDVIDFKTTAYVWREDRIETSLQPTFYAFLLDRPLVFNYHFLTRGKIGGPVGISIRRTSRTSRDIEWLTQKFIPQAAQLIREGIWLRHPGAHCTYCPHRLGCGYRC